MWLSNQLRVHEICCNFFKIQQILRRMIRWNPTTSICYSVSCKVSIKQFIQEKEKQYIHNKRSCTLIYWKNMNNWPTSFTDLVRLILSAENEQAKLKPTPEIQRIQVVCISDALLKFTIIIIGTNLRPISQLWTNQNQNIWWMLKVHCSTSYLNSLLA